MALLHVPLPEVVLCRPITAVLVSEISMRCDKSKIDIFALGYLSLVAVSFSGSFALSLGQFCFISSLWSRSRKPLLLTECDLASVDP